MILEDATYDVFGYELWEISHGSEKPILAACELCGKFRLTTKGNYHILCASCIKKGNKSALGSKHTKEWKRKNSERMKGNKYCHGNEGKTVTEEAKRNMRLNQVDQRGDKNPNYNGGQKLAWVRQSAKHRQLGYTPLNAYFKGCEGHHITHNIVIYIPKGLHKSVWHNLNTGQGMEVINALALDFLVNGF